VLGVRQRREWPRAVIRDGALRGAVRHRATPIGSWDNLYPSAIKAVRLPVNVVLKLFNDEFLITNDALDEIAD